MISACLESSWAFLTSSAYSDLACFCSWSFLSLARSCSLFYWSAVACFSRKIFSALAWAWVFWIIYYNLFSFASFSIFAYFSAFSLAYYYFFIWASYSSLAFLSAAIFSYFRLFSAAWKSFSFYSSLIFLSASLAASVSLSSFLSCST